jgi:hypothetical protein
MLLIYSPSVSRRLEYITELLFADICGVEVRLTSHYDEYETFRGPKINYSDEPAGDGIFIYATGLLSEETIRELDIRTGRYQDVTVFFEPPDPSHTYPFDLFAASFYLVSRYEEYHLSKRDKHGRFDYRQSLAWSAGFLEMPLVNIWLANFMEHARNIYPEFKCNPKPYKYLPTIDVDHVFAFKGRSLARTVGGIGRSLSEGQLREIADRFRVLFGISPDPYDTCDLIRQIHEQKGLQPLCFILYADYGKDDNNITIGSHAFRSWIRRISADAEVGIHPSLSSNYSDRILNKEIDGLSGLMGKEITRSRQHFLWSQFPKTYQRLVRHGITDDYSMGYAAVPGFRAGITHPFRFFDLTRNETLPLTIHPVQVMDVTFRDYLHLSPEDASGKIREIIDRVRSCRGQFISLWHNESLSGYRCWKGWEEVYSNLVDYATS